MKHYLLFAAAIIVLFLTSCADAKYPIDSKPSVKVDPRLVGGWKAKEKKGNKLVAADDMLYVIKKHNDFEYTIEAKTAKKKEEDTTTAFLSDVNHVWFLNVYVKGDTPGYCFLRILDINKAGDKITIASIADTTMHALTSSEQVRERITINLNNPSFYHDTAYLFKMK